VPVKANNASYCVEHQKERTIKKQRNWRKQRPDYNKRFYLSSKNNNNNFQEEDELIMTDVPQEVIYPEVSRMDVVPCLQGEGCSHKDYDKNNRICINCDLRRAYINSAHDGNYSNLGSDESSSFNAVSSYRSARS